RDAVAGLAIAADRPRPGRVHVASCGAGGFSGRRHTFLVGLDEGRHPGRDLEDPILLDEERRRINDELPEPLLPLSRERPREAAAALKACLARLRGDFTASYSSFGLRNLSQAGEPAPSPFFLDLYREGAGSAASYEDLAAALPVAAGFLAEADAALSDTEWWLSRVRSAGSGPSAPIVRGCYPWLEDGDRAEQARASEELTVWDGWVRSGTPELDPRAGGEPWSATWIQALARCPFAFFTRHVLRVEPPRDLERDPMRWLAPQDEGTLLHETFRIFFERITEAGEKPQVARHLALIQEIARAQIAAWSDRIPARSRVAFDEQQSNILFACRTLLAREEEHCRDVTPRFFEVPFGLDRQASGPRALPGSPEPVEIPVGEGRSFRLRGRIDRVDEAKDGTFHVWDYKTGWVWGVKEGAGLRGGRQIQPALYAMALEALLARLGRPGRVSRSGYFFPGRKGEGQRIVALPDPAATRDVLERLFDLVREGMFPHAVSKEDCKRCDFEAICGGVRPASARASVKLEATQAPALVRFREIHAERV
ncbi:MAG: PD-(D/E)XK nuclease family protein, partial [Thermoanaerobaculia bacterium]